MVNLESGTSRSRAVTDNCKIKTISYNSINQIDMYTLLITLALAFSILPTSNPKIINDYEEGVALAKNSDKPILLIFTGNTCEYNEQLKWLLEKDKELKEVMNEKYVNILLHVDDPTPLEKPYESKWNNQTIQIRTIGQHWANLEISKFNSNLQPLIVIMDPNEKLIIDPKPFSEIMIGLKFLMIEAEILFRQKKY